MVVRPDAPICAFVNPCVRPSPPSQRRSPERPMTRQPKNEAFARTSFLQGANAAYIEQMQAQYERNPGSVSDEWRRFFASLQEEQSGRNGGNGLGGGPSWAKPRAPIDEESDRELLGALTGDWGETKQHIQERLQARASAGGVAMSP